VDSDRVRQEYPRAMQGTIILDAHHRGPPASGNGGYVCGLLGDRIDGPAEVTLRLPTPLGRPLTLAREDAAVVLRDGKALIASVRRATLDLVVPEAPDWAACIAATERGGSFAPSVFAGCFSCGRDNPHGVNVWAAELNGHRMTAAAWVPSRDDGNGFVPAAHLWAALDCPGAMALAIGKPDLEITTGRMVGVADRDCRAGEFYRVIGWPVAVEGRKHRCGTAVIDAAGRVRARALATWIAPRMP
jgi:hypothetical protein